MRERIQRWTLDSIRSHDLSRWILLALSGLTCALFLGAPVLAARRHAASAGMIYVVFSTICHQIRSRSFFLLGHPLAVCQRCSGIYFGILLSCLLYHALPGSLRGEEKRRHWILGATTPLMMDVALSYSGFWSGAILIRYSTGFLFGFMVASVLVPAVSEFLLEIALSQVRRQSPGMEGGRL